MCSSTSEDAPGFYLRHPAPGERPLCCLACGNRTRIEDRPEAKADAEAAHDMCGAPCGCWTLAQHAAISEAEPAHG